MNDTSPDTVVTAAAAATPVTASIAAVLGPGNYRRIARSSGLTPSHVSRVLQGKRTPSLRAAKRIAEAAGISLMDLDWFISHLPSRKRVKRRAPRTR